MSEELEEEFIFKPAEEARNFRKELEEILKKREKVREIF